MWPGRIDFRFLFNRDFGKLPLALFGGSLFHLKKLQMVELKIGGKVMTDYGELTITKIEDHVTIYMLSFEEVDFRLGSNHVHGYVHPAQQRVAEKFKKYMADRTPVAPLKRGKIDTSRWLPDISPDRKETADGAIYAMEIPSDQITKYMSVSSGRSTAEVNCPFCRFIQLVYIWSFAGCGKRCDNCGVLLLHRSAIAEENRFLAHE